MSYADQLKEIADKHRMELQAAERERAASRHRAHGVACEENKKIMWQTFAEQVRNANA